MLDDPTAPPTTRWDHVRGLLPALGLGLVLVWVFWPTLLPMAQRWGNDSRYSHGYLVPLFSVYLLWARWGKGPMTGRPAWWGIAVLLVGLGLRFAGTALYFDWLAGAALLPCLAGLALAIGGWPALRWSWPAIAFLLFMVPLPYRVEIALGLPLQRTATVVSTYALQTLGFIATAEGNTIRMGDIQLGIVEACSGLSMLMIFFALSTALAVVVRRPPYQKILLVASAVPIALAANVARIVVTGVLYKTVGSRSADLVFHDLAGWLMMPLALAMLWVEMRLLAWVIVEGRRSRRREAASQPRIKARPGRRPGRTVPPTPIRQ